MPYMGRSRSRDATEISGAFEETSRPTPTTRETPRMLGRAAPTGVRFRAVSAMYDYDKCMRQDRVELSVCCDSSAPAMSAVRRCSGLSSAPVATTITSTARTTNAASAARTARRDRITGARGSGPPHRGVGPTSPSKASRSTGALSNQQTPRNYAASSAPYIRTGALAHHLPTARQRTNGELRTTQGGEFR